MKKQLINFISTAIISTMTICCTNHVESKVYDKIEEGPLFKLINPNTFPIKEVWYLEQGEGDYFNETPYYSLFGYSEGDLEERTYSLAYSEDLDSIYLEYFIKEYIDSDIYTHNISLSLDSFDNIDTLYHFKYIPENEKKFPPTSLENKIFLVGEYYYKYRHGFFDEYELEKFKENIDSLKRIRGTNLPHIQ